MESVENSESFEGYSTQFNKHLEIFSFSVGEDEYATIFKDISQRELFLRKKEELEKEITSRLKQQSALSEISQLTLSNASLKEIFHKTTEILVEALQVDYSKILRLLPQEHQFIMEAGVGWEDPDHNNYIILDNLESQAGYTLLSEKPVIVEDLSLETRFSGPQLLVDHGVTSGVSVIIGPLEDPYGVMGVHTVEHRIFSPLDVEFVQAVANVLANIINQNRISHELEKSEMRYRLLAENASDMISTHKNSGNYSYASPYSLELIGYLPEELEDESAFIFIHPDDIESVKENQAKLVSSGNIVITNYRLKHKEGNYVWVESTARILDPQTGEIIVITRDISERMVAEQELRSSLKDKEILLQEIHHRVKNNMQIISSLLNLQSNFITDPEAISVFRESQNRVKSMALLHENLYQSREMDKVDFKQYVKKLTDNLLSTYSAHSSHLKTEISSENVKLNIETAIPCGLIINELLTNSLKYAFPHGQNGTIYLKIKAINDKYVLILGDDGVGLPPNFNLESTDTLGLRLVHNLVNQIDGELKVKNSKGTCFEILFKELKYKKRI
ncbi:MAG: hypothetical protein CIT02_04260 [Methanobacterium sp. BAmetb5]|nr:MAG: hypothetical protein CIT02_04260 [Methanobacterium sp. BAmetb5]